MDTVWLTDALTGPDRPSVQDQLIVTSVLFQPLASAGVRLTNAITGAVLSILIVTEFEPERPTLFVAEQIREVPVVSEVKFVELQPEEEEIPVSGSDTFQLTLTSLVYQPLLPNVPLSDEVITGAVVSVSGVTL